MLSIFWLGKRYTKLPQHLPKSVSKPNFCTDVVHQQACLPFLSTSHPPGLQQAASNALAAVAEVDADAVWLLLMDVLSSSSKSNSSGRSSTPTTTTCSKQLAPQCLQHAKPPSSSLTGAAGISITKPPFSASTQSTSHTPHSSPPSSPDLATLLPLPSPPFPPVHALLRPLAPPHGYQSQPQTTANNSTVLTHPRSYSHHHDYYPQRTSSSPLALSFSLTAPSAPWVLSWGLAAECAPRAHALLAKMEQQAAAAASKTLEGEAGEQGGLVHVPLPMPLAALVGGPLG